MTQAVLAERAGTRQSAISAYETGRRDPTVTMLERLLNATGHELTLGAVPKGGSSPSLPNTPLGRRLDGHRAAIRAVVATHGGRGAFLFGSVARGDDDRESDIDLLVDLPERSGILTIGAIARDVERLLGVDVDIVPFTALEPETLQRIISDAIEL